MSEAPRRPASVTFLAAFVLCITAWNVLSAYGATAHWAILSEFGASPAYLAAKGLAWAVAGLWLTYALWAGRRPALFIGPALAGIYLAWYWVDRLLAQPSPAPNAGFSLAASGLLLVVFIVSVMRSRDFFCTS